MDRMKLIIKRVVSVLFDTSLNILLIDHKECDVSPIAKYLSKLGIKVNKVKCPEVGKRALQENHNYNAVITRASLPGKSGSELAGWAKANNVKSPFFLLTERDWQLHRKMLNKFGITDIITDNSSLEEIHGKIASCFAFAS